ATVRRWRDYLASERVRKGPVFALWHAFARLPADGFLDQAGQVCRDLSRASGATVNPLVTAAFDSPPRDMADVARRYGALLSGVQTRWQERLGVAKYSPGPPPEGLAELDAEALRQVLYGASSPCEVPDEPVVNTEQFFASATLNEVWKLQKEFDGWLIKSAAAPPYATILVDRPDPINARVLRRGTPALPSEQVPRRWLAHLAGPAREPFRH